jgi:dolichol-phosphate mannosyltransferase
MNRDNHELLIITATYNEAENLPILASQVMKLGLPAHLLVVDDNSPDGTGQIADELAQQTSGGVRVLHRSGKLGYASALREGFALGLQDGYRVIMTMDADLSHDPARIPALYDATEQYDIAIGSRYVPGGGTENWPLSRIVLSRTASALARLLTGLPVRDCTGGFRAYHREIIQKADLLTSETEGYSFLMETLFKCHRIGASVCEVPIVFHDRQRGQSKISKKIIFEAGWVLLKLFWCRLTGKATSSGDALHTAE